MSGTVDIFHEIISALRTEERVMLATIISTTGSTPASALSKMLVKQEGIVSLGTVGGGCMEGDVLLHARRLFQENKAQILAFHLNEDDIGHGLICGGTLDVLIEPLSKEHIPLMEELKTIRDEGEDSVLTTLLSSEGRTEGKWLSSPLPGATLQLSLPNSLTSGPNAVQGLTEAVEKAYRRQETQRVTSSRGEFILEPITGSPSLVIFGGGHVSKYISRSAAMAGFRVTIVDDREKFASSERFPEAAQTLAVDFIEAFRHLTVKASTYIVIVTRGHRHDEEILEQAVKTPARYIGMIGSKRKVLTTIEHLLEKGIQPQLIERVHAPMGIEIGAVTAEEIGISVVSQLISVRRGSAGIIRHKSEDMKKLIRTLGRKS